MPMYRWTPCMGHQVGAYKVRYRGRQAIVCDSDTADAMVSIGVFTKNKDGTIFYSAPVGIRMADGTKTPVGPDGIAELDPALIAPDLLEQKVVHEIADPEETLPEPVFTAGFDDAPPLSLMPQEVTNAKP